MHDIKELIQNYRPSREVVDMVRSAKVALLVGISGAGKSVIEERLLKSGNYHNIVSHTTRRPRVNKGIPEQDGDHYHFVDRSAMIAMIERQELIEVNLYSDNLYGMSGDEFKHASDEHRIALAAIEVNGVADVVRIAPHAVRPIFLVPPSYEVWHSRWQQRYGDQHRDHTEDIAKRRQIAINELNQGLSMAYYYPVVNDDLEEAIKEVDVIARMGEQSKASRQRGIAAIQDILQGVMQGNGKR